MGEVVEMDSKGRIVIPISIRNKLGLSLGAQLAVDMKNDEIVLSKIAAPFEEECKYNEGLEDFLADSDFR